MNFSQYTSELATHMSQISPSSIPGALWRSYLEYLWFYEPDSWVARIAYAARVIAFLVVLPLVVFALLDISSYLVARTLGVIDDVKASTSDKETVHTTDAPSIRVENTSTVSSDSMFSLDSDHDFSTDHNTHNKIRSPLSDSLFAPSESQPVFYASGEDHNAKISGVDVFSPAASQPSSPTITRQQLSFEGVLPGKETLRHRRQNSGKS